MKPMQTLDRKGIAARIPHGGRMCLLDGLLGWDDAHVRCRASSHHDADNPLRGRLGLLSACAIEYASQAMALHAALHLEHGEAPGSAARAGFLASARRVRLHVPRLDTVAGALHVTARRQIGDARQAIYSFELADEGGRALVDGRLTVVLDATLPVPGQ